MRSDRAAAHTWDKTASSQLTLRYDRLAKSLPSEPPKDAMLHAMGFVFYVAVCLIFPLLWAAALARFFARRDRRRQLEEMRSRLPPTDYAI